jgi:hypothetical protein
MRLAPTLKPPNACASAPGRQLPPLLLARQVVVERHADSGPLQTDAEGPASPAPTFNLHERPAGWASGACHCLTPPRSLQFISLQIELQLKFQGNIRVKIDNRCLHFVLTNRIIFPKFEVHSSQALRPIRSYPNPSFPGLFL